MNDLRHISHALHDVLHRFEVEEKNVRSPIMRRFRFDCECEVKGPWHRDRDSAREDGFAHQDAEL